MGAAWGTVIVGVVGWDMFMTGASGIDAELVSPTIAGGGELVMSDEGKFAVGTWPVTETKEA